MKDERAAQEPRIDKAIRVAKTQIEKTCQKNRVEGRQTQGRLERELFQSRFKYAVKRRVKVLADDGEISLHPCKHAGDRE